MGRTRLLGLCIADLRIAIEAPPALPWRWGDDPEAAFAASPEEADLAVGVRLAPLGRGARPVLKAGCGERLEVSRSATGWRVLHRRGGVVEREASFDACLRAGEVVLDPSSAAARSGAYPLAFPLDAWVVRQRLALEGGLLLRGFAALRGERALLFTSSDESDSSGLFAGLTAASGPRAIGGPFVALRADGTGVRVHGTPWGYAESSIPRSAPLEAVHLLHPAPALAAAPLCGAEAVGAVLPALAPLDGSEPQALALAALERLVERVPVVRLGAPDAETALRFATGRDCAALGRLWPRSA
jgi:hypothetical protein